MITKFMEWLNSEIKKLENVKDEDKMFILGKYFEAVRIRAKFLNMLAELNKTHSKPPRDEEILDMLHDMWKQRIEERAKYD